MKIRMVPSSVGQEKYQFAASYVINQSLAIDAGSIGFSKLDEQKRIRHIFVSHAHLDHIASLPIFLDNVYEPGPNCPIIYGSPTVIECLQKYFFNDHVWPDILRLQSAESPFVRFVSLEANKPITVEGLTITPVPLRHVVPCLGFIVEEPGSAVAFVSDTAPTEEIWSVARNIPDLKAVFLEAAFPNSFAWLAEKATHLTPAQFLSEYRKLGKDVTLVAIHIKCGFHDQVVAELAQLGIPKLLISEPGHLYEF